MMSDTESRDLFYRFDTVGRFHAAQARPLDDSAASAEADRADAGRFIAFEALGRAIRHAKPPAIEAELRLPPGSLAHPGAPRRSSTRSTRRPATCRTTSWWRSSLWNSASRSSPAPAASWCAWR